MAKKETILIETERFYIKKLDRMDYAEYFSQQKNHFLTRYFGGPRKDESIKMFFDLLISHQERYGFSMGLVFLKKDNIIIGRAGLVHLDFKPVEEVEIGCFIFEPYCKQGYATEIINSLVQYAFDVLGVSKVYATVDPNNIAPRRTIEKLNFVLEKQDFYETLDKVVNFYVKAK